MLQIPRVILGLLAVLVFVPAARAQAEAAPVRIGMLAFLGWEAAFSDWSPLARHLEAALPARRFALAYYDRASCGARGPRGTAE